MAVVGVLVFRQGATVCIVAVYSGCWAEVECGAQKGLHGWPPDVTSTATLQFPF